MTFDTAVLIFLAGAGAGALLLAMQRTTAMQRIRMEFEAQLTSAVMESLAAEKKDYATPMLARFATSSDVPDLVRNLLSAEARAKLPSIAEHPELQGECLALMDGQRRYVDVNDRFCQLLGYKREDLLGRRYDDLTLPNTIDVDRQFQSFLRTGESQGLWMASSRHGIPVLFRYRARILPDACIGTELEPVTVPLSA